MISEILSQTPEEKSATKKDVALENARKIYTEHFEGDYPSLGEQLDSPNPKDKEIAANTAQVLLNQKLFMQEAKSQYGESTVISKLGSIAPKIMDVVRVN